ncbi:Hypothetical predicted protein [Olea europaea subsp. europaea]|uniref:Uncharacterized protein n=1 Tax=Olea europaea subsp. europaea TaxID=158383 RepID=A0A8S0SXF6_OLEEU|nr:Hypothetical predicted protein [Olea europaea subsp. europaea]
MASAVVGLNESVKWQLIRLVNGDSKPSEDLDSKVMKGEAISSNYCTPEDETDDANQDFHLNKDREKAFPVRDERLLEFKINATALVSAIMLIMLHL